MTCYTVGNEVNYERAIGEFGFGNVLKVMGGFAFRTIADAESFLVEQEVAGVWAIWEVEADYDRDTKDGFLLIDAPIIAKAAPARKP